MKRKGFVLIIFLLASFGFLISNNVKVCGALNIGNLKVDDTFTWLVNYNNTYLTMVNFMDQITFTIETINEDNLVVRMSYGTSYSSEFVYPQNALDYLPMGSQIDIVNQPGAESFILPLAMITTDWVEHRDKWYNRDIMNTFTQVSWTWNRIYNYEGALRSVYIFAAESINYNFNEPTAMNFSITYAEKNGLLLNYDFDLIGQDSGDTINLSITLVSSTKSIGWSYWMKLIVTFSTTYAPVSLVGGITLAIVLIRNRLKRLEEIEEDEDDEDETDDYEKDVKEDITDYSFIRICSFCKAEVPEESKICPECGGKK